MSLADKTFSLKLIQKEKVSDNVIHLKFSSEQKKLTEFIPGQFLSLKLDDHNQRSYSIASTAGVDELFETYVDLSPAGIGSQKLSALELGDELVALGPLGRFVFNDTELNQTSPIIFLATGTGVVPIYSILKEILLVRKLKNPIKLYWGLRSETDLYLQQELQQLQASGSNFDFQIILSQPSSNWNGVSGYCNQQLVKDWSNLTNSSQAAFYLCGSKEMIGETTIILTEQFAVPSTKIFFEKYY